VADRSSYSRRVIATSLVVERKLIRFVIVATVRVQVIGR